MLVLGDLAQVLQIHLVAHGEDLQRVHDRRILLIIITGRRYHSAQSHVVHALPGAGRIGEAAPHEPQPVVEVGERLRVGDVVAEEDDVAAEDVLAKHARAHTLAADVPDLQLDPFIAPQHQLLLEEVQPHRLLVHAVEPVGGEPRDDRRLAHRTVAQQDQLDRRVLRVHVAPRLTRHDGRVWAVRKEGKMRAQL